MRDRITIGHKTSVGQKFRATNNFKVDDFFFFFNLCGGYLTNIAEVFDIYSQINLSFLCHSKQLF